VKLCEKPLKTDQSIIDWYDERQEGATTSDIPYIYFVREILFLAGKGQESLKR